MVKLSNDLLSIIDWIEKAKYKGWDPYDVKSHKLSIKIFNLRLGIIGKIIKKFYIEFIEVFPNLMRKLLLIEPLENAKGVGLILTSYSILYRKTSSVTFLDKALDCVEWLDNNKGNNYSGLNWGYPFDWQSSIFIPRGTPSSVVTYTVGNGYYELYLATGNVEYLAKCKEVCIFFIENLNITYEQENKLCFSYTPIDDYQVHNANLFVAEFLIKIGNEIKNNEWIEKGLKCVNFAISEQQKEGFLPYWGLEQTNKYSGKKIRVDHYHAGFEIRMLFSIWKITKLKEIEIAWKKYFQWYFNNLFTKEGIPKLTPTSYYPINIHSIAEAILCLSTLNEYYKNLDESIEKIKQFASKNMQFRKGQYSYMIKKIPIIGEYKVKIPMLRWGQAWMLLAYCSNIKDENEE